MTTYEIRPLLFHPDVSESDVRPIRVSAHYIENEPSLNAAQKAAIAALAPGGIWTGRAIEVRRLEEPTLH